MPYSQRVQIRDLPYTGGANGWPGRHIFRIDEKILPGVCIRDLSKLSSISDTWCLIVDIVLVGTNLPLVFAPENGNMLGGTIVNMTGPCYIPGTRITCRWVGGWINENKESRKSWVFLNILNWLNILNTFVFDDWFFYNSSLPDLFCWKSFSPNKYVTGILLLTVHHNNFYNISPFCHNLCLLKNY